MARSSTARPAAGSAGPAADLPGINLNFPEVPEEPAPTRGRTLDHIGFEGEDLATCSAALDALGAMPIARAP